MLTVIPPKYNGFLWYFKFLLASNIVNFTFYLFKQYSHGNIYSFHVFYDVVDHAKWRHVRHNDVHSINCIYFFVCLGFMAYHSIALLIVCCFVSWRLRRPHWGHANRAEGIFGFCRMCVGCGPESRSTLKKALCRTCMVEGWRTNKISAFVGYLMLNRFYTNKQFYFKQ